MEKFKVSFEANNQQLKSIGTKHASDTYADIEATFILGEKWTDMDSVSAVWWNDFTRIATVLDSQGKCIVPHEVLARKGCVRVNLVGSIVEGDELITRLTSYSAEAVQVNEKIKLTGSETSEVTPSQFEQFVALVIAEVEKVTGMTAVAETLPAGSPATARYENGKLYLGIPQGIQGETGNGIASVVLNSDYTLTLRFTDGTSYTTASIRGEKGEKGNTGERGPIGPQGETGPQGPKGDQGIQGIQGETGATPNLTIGAVETLAPTEDATASITGTAEEPILNLGIPKGDTGEVSQAEFDEAITDLKSDIAQFITDDVISHVDSDIQKGSYRVGSNSKVVFDSNTSYYSVVSDLSNYEVGSEVIAKASLANHSGLIIYDINNNALEYITDDNATEKGYVSSSTPASIKLTIPQKAKSLSASIRNAFYTDINDFNVTVRTNVINNEIESIKTALTDEVVKKNIGKNKFDASTSVDGFIEAYNGSINPTAGRYKTTDFIDISNFEYSVCVSPRLRYALQYDQNKIYIKSTYISTVMDDAIIPINADAKYIRISYYANQENALQVEDNTSCTTYEQYSMYVEGSVNCFNSKTRESVEDFIGSLDISAYNPLKDKKWAHCGDSFSAYTNANFDSGMFQGREKTFPRLIAERNRMNLLQQFMMSGRTLAYPSDGTFTNSLTCPTNTGYYQNIPTDVDIVTIMLGINDSQHTGSGTTGDGEDATGVITLGTIDDATTATYYGAWNVVLGWLRENRPFAHVGIIVTNGTERQDYTDAQIAIAKKWGYPMINLNGDEHASAMLRCYNPDIPASLKAKLKEKQAVDYDGTITGSINLHPNYQTHELESTTIETWLRSL